MRKEHPFEMTRFEHEGYTFFAEFFYDPDSGPPWDECDGHGPVRAVSTPSYGKPSKRPGERFLNRDPGDSRSTLFAYDWAEACKLARKDGWNAEPLDAPNRVERAVQADFDYLAGWVNDEWHYCGVVVTLLEDGEKNEEHTDSLWRVETHKDYHYEEARECAGNIARDLREEARREETEAAQAELDREIESNTKD